MCWLYSVPNLLVFEHLDTLYLGGNYVKVVCEKSMKNSSVWAFRGFSRLDLASDSWLATRQNATHVKHARSWRVTTTGALQDKKYSLTWQLSRDSSTRKTKLPEYPVMQKKWHFTFLTYTTINNCGGNRPGCPHQYTHWAKGPVQGRTLPRSWEEPLLGQV